MKLYEKTAGEVNIALWGLFSFANEYICDVSLSIHSSKINYSAQVCGNKETCHPVQTMKLTDTFEYRTYPESQNIHRISHLS